MRSARQKYGSPGVGIAGPHQASSIRSSAAPARWPARWPSPVFSLAPTVQAVPIGCRWYCARIAALCSNPPEPTMTPRRARTSPFGTRTPVTAPFSTFRSTSGVFSHTGTFAASRPARSPAASAWPMVSGFCPASAAAVPRARHAAATAAPLAFTAARFSHL